MLSWIKFSVESVIYVSMELLYYRVEIDNLLLINLSLLFKFLKLEDALFSLLSLWFKYCVMCFIFLLSMTSLLKDFVESEYFLIDGDSLFIKCVLNVNLERGQTLHFFYIVEQFLHDFIQKEAKFVIVFFKVRKH